MGVALEACPKRDKGAGEETVAKGILEGVSSYNG
jgi:hypothetical protein